MTTLKMRISVNKRKGDDREKGLKITRNLLITDNKLESKKRACSDDFNGKEIKKRRKSCLRNHSSSSPTATLLAAHRSSHHSSSSSTATIHGSGWDRQNKPKSRETSEQGCLRNLRGGRDCQMKTPPPLHSEKESRRFDHSSSCATTAAIDKESCSTTSLTVGAPLSPTHALRAAQMKERYAHLIFKANLHLAAMNQGDNNADPLKQQQERERREIAEKARIEEEIKAAQTLLRMRAEADLKIQREAARISLENMEKTVEFDDAMQIIRDFESLLNAPVC
ncbi:PREDICTED: transcription factor GTE10-like [Ipomoea nil]|uniref:transcription factor GTE10-like n=1 Tax=Ipomoea nil TaxID=35883 RepID=UPI000900C7BA|nr:PREDICTED: transcription factor GTE10-like [Ipomoea nil]